VSHKIGKPSTGQDVRSVAARAERSLWRRWKWLRQSVGLDLPRQTVFVAGMQRSGTNMVMETLEWSLYTDVYHETDPRAFLNYEMRSREVIRSLQKKSGAPFFVIKSLCELDQLKQLLDDFAPAKALWIVRTYDDSVNSAIRSFRNFADQLGRISQDRLSDGWRGRGMSNATHALLAQLYHPEINEASAAAVMWYYRNILFFEQDFQDDPRVQVVFYEDLVTEPVASFEKIFQFLRLPAFSPWITRKIYASSIRKTRVQDIEPKVRAICDELTQRLRSTKA
jgi:hypothetical protein